MGQPKFPPHDVFDRLAGGFLDVDECNDSHELRARGAQALEGAEY